MSERDWKDDLNKLFDTERRNKAKEAEREKEYHEKLACFVEAVAVPALEEVRAALIEHGKEFEIHKSREGASFSLKRADRPFRYSIDGRKGFLVSESMVRGVRSEGTLQPKANGDPLTTLTKGDIIDDVLQWLQSNKSELLS